MKKILFLLLISNISLASINFQEKKINAKKNKTVENSYKKKKKLLYEIKKHLGKPYVYGASSNDINKFDCSSFVQKVFKDIGIKLPRTSKEQSNISSKIKLNSLELGDLIFFDTLGHGVSHVGIYLGNGKFVHASSGKRKVIVSKIQGKYLSDALYGERLIY